MEVELIKPNGTVQTHESDYFEFKVTGAVSKLL